MLIGGHFPISGGLDKAVILAEKAGANTLQLFTKNPGQWKARVIDDAEAENFKSLCSEKCISPVAVHDSYLINMASGKDALRKKGNAAFSEEIKRAGHIGADYLITHMGSYTGITEEEGMKNLRESVKSHVETAEENNVTILLETTAGMGKSLGYKFEHLARVMEYSGNHKNIAVCMDTCHIFAAGYDVSTEVGYKRTMDEFDRVIGLGRLKLVHMNDAKKELGSRVDRHAHIGEGFIGLKGFSFIMNDPVFKKIPLIVETAEPEKMHAVNIKRLRELVVKE